MDFSEIPLCSGVYLTEEGIVSYNWPLIYMLIIGNLMVAIAYFLIPFLLNHLKKNRPDMPFMVKRTITLFECFISACALTHLAACFGVISSASGSWGLTAFYTMAAVETITGLISWVTVWMLYKHGSYFVTLPKMSAFEEIIKREEEIRDLRDFIKENGFDLK